MTQRFYNSFFFCISKMWIIPLLLLLIILTLMLTTGSDEDEEKIIIILRELGPGYGFCVHLNGSDAVIPQSYSVDCSSHAEIVNFLKKTTAKPFWKAIILPTGRSRSFYQGWLVKAFANEWRIVLTEATIESHSEFLWGYSEAASQILCYPARNLELKLCECKIDTLPPQIEMFHALLNFPTIRSIGNKFIFRRGPSSWREMQIEGLRKPEEFNIPMVWCTEKFFIGFNRQFESEVISKLIVGINAGFLTIHHKDVPLLLNSDSIRLYCNNNNIVFPLDTVDRGIDHNFILYITVMRSYEQILDGQNKLELITKNLVQAVEDYKANKLMPEIEISPENMVLWGPIFNYQTGNVINSKAGYNQKIKLYRKRNTFQGVPRFDFRDCSSIFNLADVALITSFNTNRGFISIEIKERDRFLSANINRPPNGKYKPILIFLRLFTPFLTVRSINGVELVTDVPKISKPKLQNAGQSNFGTR